ncbi:flagellin [Limnohabitans sp. DCL3]|uniref:flagellin N-terminal helical domain-containing protein n=1 Tax=Limnohabitans sp. DCL3 TaxID=3374103 RepID=UPI003A87DF36
MTVINTNINSLVTQNALTRNNRALSTSMEQLSTGKRINSAADDAAGLAITNKMTSQIRALNQGIRNANDGISLMQTAEGATTEITNMLQRMRELAVQASNDTYTSFDRSALNAEVTALKSEISRIGDNTEWNGMKLFTNKSAGSAGGIGVSGTVRLQLGVDGKDSDRIEVKLNEINSKKLGVSGLSLANLSGATSALATLDKAIGMIDDDRARFGATINRLTYAVDNLTNVSQNTSASRSRILDTDYAKASSEMARTQIIQQAATAILAQANQSQQSVLKLLG